MTLIYDRCLLPGMIALDARLYVHYQYHDLPIVVRVSCDQVILDLFSSLSRNTQRLAARRYTL